MNTIPTNYGQLSIGEAMDNMEYKAYKTQRDLGTPASIVLKWMGTPEMEERYQIERQKNYN